MVGIGVGGAMVVSIILSILVWRRVVLIFRGADVVLQIGIYVVVLKFEKLFLLYGSVPLGSR
jgi:hypothetical protein